MTISYCITLYNKEKYISDVLDAALAEREATGGEILVYDDGSTDRSAEIVQKIAAHAPIRLLGEKQNAGVFAATNILLMKASQPYIRIIDGDDQITRGSTRHLLDIQRRYDSILVHGAAGVIGRDNPSLSLADASVASAAVETHAFRNSLRALRYNLSVTLIPTVAAKSILPLPSNLRISQDLCIALRLAKKGTFVATTAVVSLSPEESSNRLSRRLAAMYRDTCLIAAMELGQDATRADAAFAVRRNAVRCRNYFRREAPGRLTAADKLSLVRYSMACAIEPVERQCARLRHMAKLYTLDDTRVLL